MQVGGTTLSTSLSEGKSFEISKWEVWQAYERVKANKGAPGVDGVDLAAFEEHLQGNLFKIWNRMSSRSDFPPPVRAVPIPKPDGRVRMLGVPTIADRIAQTVVAARLEAGVEPMFHPDSYGCRPVRSALDAVAMTRRRCWSKDWVLDLDIRAFVDSVDHALLIKAVASQVAYPPAGRCQPRRPRPMDGSHRAGLDAVLRGVHPLRAAVSTAAPNQHLPGAVGPQEVSSVARARRSRPGGARSPRATGMGSCGA